MLKRYETLVLAAPEITEDEISDIERQMQKFVKAAKGEFVSFDRWGKCRLSYPIQHHDYGLYFLFRFEADEATKIFADMKSLFTMKYNAVVMRTVNKLLKTTAPIAYQRPLSVEETPARDVNTFLRENKMEGLLSPRSRQDDVIATKAHGEDVDTLDLESTEEGEA